jgi:maltooligosyltrehalose trehalohydrolase
VEFRASTPFLFFGDFGPELAQAVTRGRREEFARFARFGDPDAIPDPNAESTFAASKLDWREAAAPPGSEWRAFYRDCLERRRRHVMPLLDAMRHGGTFDVDGKLLRVTWSAGGERSLHLVANLGDEPCEDVTMPQGETVFATGATPAPGTHGRMPRWGVTFVVTAAR